MKKHYEAVADIINKSHSTDDIIEGLADLYSKENPKFDREKFMRRCTQI